MAALKDELYKRDAMRELAGELAKAHPGFDERTFLRKVFATGWDDLELKERMRRVTTALHATLDLPYRKAARILGKAARRKQGFHYISLSDYVEVYGQDDLETSIRALRATTLACSSEFAIRPFLINHPDRMITEMRDWATDPDHRIRRLASEGCRPRLPWGVALPALKKDPAPILPTLEQLKDDPVESVRRSVANNLNDISKDNPDIFLQVANRWHGKDAQTDKLLKHAARTLLKRGHPAALKLFGVDDTKALVRKLRLAQTEVAIGSDLTFEFELKVDSPTKVRLDFAIYYLRKDGQHSRKVYRISEGSYDGVTCFTRRRSMKDLSTRTHNPGAHFIALIVNGREGRRRRFTLKVPRRKARRGAK